MVVVQELSDRDMANRSTAVEHLAGILSDDVIILMAGEAHFHLSGSVNKQDFHYWGEEDPQQLHQWPLYGVCVANFRGTGPSFFEDEDGHAVTLISARHIEMLWNFLTPELNHGIELSTIWFWQDGATAHTAIASMEVI
jgi:hypothetical protein